MEKMKLVIFLFAENLTITLLLILRNIYTKYLCFFNELITFLLFNIVELNMIVYSCSDTLYICLFFEIMLRIYLLKKIKKFNVFSTFLKGLIIYFYLACLENYSLIYSYIFCSLSSCEGSNLHFLIKKNSNNYQIDYSR